MSSRRGEDAEYIFVQNFRPETVDFRPEVEDCEVLFGEVTGAMAPFSTIVLKKVL